MIAMIADVPLETIPGVSVHRTGQNAYLRIGVFQFQSLCNLRSISKDKDISGSLNRKLLTNVRKWYWYSIEEEGLYYANPFLDLFVYKILREGDHIVFYRKVALDMFDQDVPVASIDIFDKGPDESPYRVQMHDDAIYHITDRMNTAHRHNTSILEEAGKGTPIYPPLGIGTIPDRNITVGELMEIAGNLITVVSVFDWSKCMESGRIIRFLRPLIAHKYCDCPLEAVILREIDEDSRYHLEDGEFPKSEGFSIYNNSIVKGFALYNSSNVIALSMIGVDCWWIGEDGFGLVILIDGQSPPANAISKEEHTPELQ